MDLEETKERLKEENDVPGVEVEEDSSDVLLGRGADTSTGRWICVSEDGDMIRMEYCRGGMAGELLDKVKVNKDDYSPEEAVRFAKDHLI